MRTRRGPCRQRLGDLGRRCQRAGCRRKRCEACISLRVHLDALARPARVSYDPSVLAERVGIALGAQLVQELRRALDIGEEKRDGSGREVGAHGQ
jgi:hypothetical protein